MIELVNVEKTYHTSSGDIHALKRTSLTINQGEIFGIIGLSGAGKSTLIRCINMLEVPTAGQVFVDGEELTAMTETQLRKARQNIGMIFQHFNLLASRTVFDNIAFPLEIQGLGKDEIKKRVEPLLELVQLQDRADHYPSQLSGGQKQRVGIARALVINPDLLLMDEPFSALDAQTRTIMQEELVTLWDKTRLSTLYVTHNIQEAVMLADRVVLLSRRPGKISRILNIGIPRAERELPQHTEEIAEYIRIIWEHISKDARAALMEVEGNE